MWVQQCSDDQFKWLSEKIFCYGTQDFKIEMNAEQEKDFEISSQYSSLKIKEKVWTYEEFKSSFEKFLGAGQK